MEIFDNLDFTNSIHGYVNNENFFKCHVPGNQNEKYYKKDKLREFLELVTLDNYFFFNGIFYKQIDGVAISIPLPKGF